MVCMEITFANDIQKCQLAAYEGPTRAQVRKMVAVRMGYLASAQTALAAGHDERAFDLDCLAFDIEADLTRYGFTTEGKIA
jgi:hypothetical protein